MLRHRTESLLEACRGGGHVDRVDAVRLLVAAQVTQREPRTEACGARACPQVGEAERRVARQPGRALQQPDDRLPDGGHSRHVQLQCIPAGEAVESVLLDGPRLGRFGLDLIRAMVEPARIVPRAEGAACGLHLGRVLLKPVVERVQHGHE